MALALSLRAADVQNAVYTADQGGLPGQQVNKREFHSSACDIVTQLSAAQANYFISGLGDMSAYEASQCWCRVLQLGPRLAPDQLTHTQDNCLFADPFRLGLGLLLHDWSQSVTNTCLVCSAFRGVARFKKNVSNFSGLLKDVNLRCCCPSACCT